MPDVNFHKAKLDEILDAYSEHLFIQGICLFYIGVHAIDYILAYKFNIKDIPTHRGRKKKILELFDEKTAEYFSQLLTYSLAIRYNEISSEEIVYKMKKSLQNLVEHLNENYNFPPDLKKKIIEKNS